MELRDRRLCHGGVNEGWDWTLSFECDHFVGCTLHVSLLFRKLPRRAMSRVSAFQGVSRLAAEGGGRGEKFLRRELLS